MTNRSDVSVLFIANGDEGSAAVERARRIAEVTVGRTQVLARSSGRFRSVRTMAGQARSFRPDLVYCVDLAVVPVSTAVFANRSAGLIVDTGDYPSAFFHQVGAPLVKVAAARAMEELVYRRADAVVVRGYHHAAVMRGHGVRRVEVIPDGVDLELVRPCPDAALRARLGLADVLTVGIAGHFTWYERLGGGLGWELVHLLARTQDLQVHGVLIGDGPGLAHLRVLAGELGVADRLHVLGRVPYDQYTRYLSLIDVCLLTQTNDPSSWIRTTGKLAGYMAAGRYVLASAVGTAESVLPVAMLVPYAGRWDDNYPAKLEERLREIAAHPDMLADGAKLRPLAASFDYSRVSTRAATLISDILAIAA